MNSKGFAQRLVAVTGGPSASTAAAAVEPHRTCWTERNLLEWLQSRKMEREVRSIFFFFDFFGSSSVLTKAYIILIH